MFVVGVGKVVVDLVYDVFVMVQYGYIFLFLQISYNYIFKENFECMQIVECFLMNFMMFQIYGFYMYNVV